MAGDEREPLRHDDVRAVVAAHCFREQRGPDRVGLEAELLPVRLGDDGVPAGRLPLAGPRSSVAVLDATAPYDWIRQGPQGPFELPGGRLTFEPGGQLEVSTNPVEGPSAAIEQVAAVGAHLADSFGRAGVALVSIGLDPWHPVAAVPQQLTAPRYPAMAAYLATRSPAGAVMMRQTAALQLNVDAGSARSRNLRWEVANLVAPLTTGTFACSPGFGRGPAGRARAWSKLDRTRTGFPAGVLQGDVDATETMTAAALDADVLLVERPDGTRPGRAGWRFRDWLRHPDPEVGGPTVADLRRHLTTLFHEVRPRGPLEIRSIDALPARWRAVPVVLYAGLLYDPATTRRIADLLTPYRGRLLELHARAVDTGVADGELCALAVEVWSLALAGARRLSQPPKAAHLLAVENFLDRYTTRGRCPGDELAELLDTTPAAAVAFGAEPLPTLQVTT